MSSLRITAGTLRGRRIPVPAGHVRPTSERARQAYFNIIGERIEGARFLDLFAGSGIFSFEALSRGAASATAVDHDVTAITREASKLGVTVAAMSGDVLTVLKRLHDPLDLVYADPPYDYDKYDELVGAIANLQLADDGIIAVEHRRNTTPFNRGPRTENRGPRTEDLGPRTEDREPRTENRGPRTENRGPRTEDRGPRTEDREPRTEKRGLEPWRTAEYGEVWIAFFRPSLPQELQ